MPPLLLSPPSPLPVPSSPPDTSTDGGGGDGDGREKCFAKLVIVGECGVGKTSLLRAFCDSDYSPSYVSTIGVDFRIVTIPVGNVDVKLHVWDTAGQERYKSLTASYFRGAMGVLVCYDASSPYDQVKPVRRWLQIIDKAADEDTTIMLVGTKLDKCQGYNGITGEQYTDDSVCTMEALAEELDIPCTLTSSLQNVNVKSAFVEIVHDIKAKGKLRHSKFNTATTTVGGGRSEVDNNNNGLCVVNLHSGDESAAAVHRLNAGDSGTLSTARQTKKAMSCACRACSC